MYITNFKLTEADVAAEFYRKCRWDGFGLRMEVKMPSDVHRSGFMRVDALVFDEERIVCAIEFKNNRKHAAKPGSRQYTAYSGLDIPFFFCCGMQEIEDTLHDVNALADTLRYRLYLKLAGDSE